MKLLELKTFGVLFFLSIIIFFVDGTGLLNLPKSVAQTAILPVQYGLAVVKQTGEETFSFLTFWKSGEARIKNLELRVMELNAADLKAKNLELENGELRKQLGVKPLAKRKMLPATVLGSGRYFEIGVGIFDGVTLGQAVIYLDNYIGTVVRVTPKASFVQLPTDPQAKVPIKINTASGLALGQFNSSIILDRVAQTEDFKVGDLVLTSGEGGSLEPNLVLGKVSKITSLETDIFKKGEITPLVNYSQLTTVFVLL